MHVLREAQVDRVALSSQPPPHHYALHPQVISGKDKGTVGLIKEVLSTKGECVVEGVNIKVSHTPAKHQCNMPD